MRTAAIALALAATAGATTRARRPLFAQNECVDPSKPVLAGIDVVAFKVDGLNSSVDVPVFGSANFTGVLNGYSFYFSSAAHQQLFAADPWKYAPAWGGF